MLSTWENKAVIVNNTTVVLHGVKPGESKEIVIDSSGVPKDKNWRRRLKDATLDGCVSIIPKKSSVKTSKSKEASE